MASHGCGITAVVENDGRDTSGCLAKCVNRDTYHRQLTNCCFWPIAHRPARPGGVWNHRQGGLSLMSQAARPAAGEGTGRGMAVGTSMRKRTRQSSTPVGEADITRANVLAHWRMPPDLAIFAPGFTRWALPMRAHNFRRYGVSLARSSRIGPSLPTGMMATRTRTKRSAGLAARASSTAACAGIARSPSTIAASLISTRAISNRRSPTTMSALDVMPGLHLSVKLTGAWSIT